VCRSTSDPTTVSTGDSTTVSTSDSTTVSTSDSTTVSTSDSNAFISWKHQQSARRADDVDEYFRYIREPPVPNSYIKQGACSW